MTLIISDIMYIIRYDSKTYGQAPEFVSCPYAPVPTPHGYVTEWQSEGVLNAATSSIQTLLVSLSYWELIDSAIGIA